MALPRSLHRLFRPAPYRSSGGHRPVTGCSDLVRFAYFLPSKRSPFAICGSPVIRRERLARTSCGFRQKSWVVTSARPAVSRLSDSFLRAEAPNVQSFTPCGRPEGWGRTDRSSSTWWPRSPSVTWSRPIPAGCQCTAARRSSSDREGELRYIIRKGAPRGGVRAGEVDPRRRYICSGGGGWSKQGNDWVEPTSALRRLHARAAALRSRRETSSSSLPRSGWEGSSGAETPLRLALCVGINAYPARPLRGAIPDLDRWSTTLEDFLWLPGRPTGRRGGDPGGDSRSSRLFSVWRARGTPSSSPSPATGHATSRRRPTLSPTNRTAGTRRSVPSTPTREPTSSTTSRRIFDQFDPGASVTVFLDCCHAGSGTRAPNLRSIPWSRASPRGAAFLPPGPWAPRGPQRSASGAGRGHLRRLACPSSKSSISQREISSLPRRPAISRRRQDGGPTNSSWKLLTGEIQP